VLRSHPARTPHRQPGDLRPRARRVASRSGFLGRPRLDQGPPSTPKRLHVNWPTRLGAVLGSMCVVDVRPRTFAGNVIDSLHDIAARVSRHLEEEENLAKRTRVPLRRVTVHQLREQAEAILAALAIIEATARRTQRLERTDMTEGILESARTTIREVLALHGELVRAGGELDAMIAAFEVGRHAFDSLRRQAAEISRSLAEASVMARVADAFARGKLDGRSAARALSVSRDLLFVVDALIVASRSMLASLDAVEPNVVGGVQ
jgi:hypothetical protein